MILSAEFSGVFFVLATCPTDCPPWCPQCLPPLCPACWLEIFVQLADWSPWSVNTRHLCLLHPPTLPTSTRRKYQHQEKVQVPVPVSGESTSHQPGEKYKVCIWEDSTWWWMSTWGRRSCFVPQISWKLNFAPVLVKVQKPHHQDANIRQSIGIIITSTIMHWHWRETWNEQVNMWKYQISLHVLNSTSNLINQIKVGW